MVKNLKGELILTEIKEHIKIKKQKEEEFVIKMRTVIFSDEDKTITLRYTKEAYDHPLSDLTESDVNEVMGVFSMKIIPNTQKQITDEFEEE